LDYWKAGTVQESMNWCQYTLVRGPRLDLYQQRTDLRAKQHHRGSGVCP